MSTEDNDSVQNEASQTQEEERPTVADAIKFVQYTAATDIGMRREENQDSYGVIENKAFRFFIVADGMGGVQGGATASKMAVSIVEQFLKDKKVLTVNDIYESISVANKLIFEKGTQDASLNGMGTTFVGIAFVDNKIFVVNVGDSRAYCIRGNRIQRLTEDHTLVMELVRSGTISVEQASNHPVSHMLTRSLGPTPEIEIDCHLSNTCPIPDDCYLLCSDGLYNMVAESEMLEIISQNSLDQATEMLIELANQRGGTDNITLILIKTDSNFPADEGILKQSDEERDSFGEQETYTETMSSEEFEDSELEGSSDLLDSFDPFALPSEPPKKPAAVKPSEEPAPAAEASTAAEVSEEVSKEEDPASQEEKPLPDSSTSAEALPAESGENKEGESPPRSTQSIILTGVLAGIICGTIVVILSKLLFFKPVTGNEHSKVSFLPKDEAQVEDAEKIYNIPVQKIPNIGKSDSMILPMRQEPEVKSSASAPSQAEIERDAQAVSLVVQESLENRREKLLVSIEDTKINIKRFADPATANIPESLKAEEQKYNSLSDNLKQVRNEIDNAARKLGIWYTRKTKVKDADSTNLASEVAVSSEEVRKKKEEFEQASWNYLKEAEALRYMPTNGEQRKKVDQLIEMRNKKIQEMSDTVVIAIDKEIKVVEKNITDYTVQREKLQNQLDYAEKNMQYLKILSGDDEELKKQKQQELENMLLSLESELGELQGLLPEKNAPGREKAAESGKNGVNEETVSAN